MTKERGLEPAGGFGGALPRVSTADVGTVVTRHGIQTVEPLIRPYLRHTPAITTATAITAATAPSVTPAAVPAATTTAPPAAITSAQRIRHRRGDGHITWRSGEPGMATRYPAGHPSCRRQRAAAWLNA